MPEINIAAAALPRRLDARLFICISQTGSYLCDGRWALRHRRRWRAPCARVCTSSGTSSSTIMLTINPSINERTHQQTHETMNLPTGTQIMTTFSKARCAHRKCLQFQAISAKASVGCAPGKSQKVIVRVITPLELERGSLPVWTPANAIPTLSRTVSVFTNREMR